MLNNVKRLYHSSDLHLEFYKESNEGFNLFPKADKEAVLLLNGDINIWKYGNKFKANAPIVKLLTYLSQHFKAIVYVPGNHEYYRGSAGGYFERKIKEFLAAESIDNVFVLQNETLLMNEGEVRILGTTLWTDMGRNDPVFGFSVQRTNGARSPLNDLNHIRYSEDGKSFSRLTVERIQRMHIKAVNYLNSELDGEYRRVTIVASHHLPSFRYVNENFRHDYLTPAYASDLDHLVEKADLWIYGHSHDCVDYVDAMTNTRILSNAAGYKHKVNPDFNPQQCVEF